MRKLLIISLLAFLILPLASAADFAYIVRSSTGIDSDLLSEIHALGYTTETIFESQVPAKNLSDYRVLILGNQDLTNPKSIPFHQHRSLIINSYDYSDLGLSSQTGKKSSPTLLTIKKEDSPIVASLPLNFNAYTHYDILTSTSYLNGKKPTGISIIVSAGTISDSVVATIQPGTRFLNGNTATERNLFFGATKADYWTLSTRKLFANSLEWLLFGEDTDGDGVPSSEDCNDSNPEIWQLLTGFRDSDEDGFTFGAAMQICSGDSLPSGYEEIQNPEDCNDSDYEINPEAEEIPYDGIDQNCDGFDLEDIDNDGFDGGADGLDCNDSDASIHPGAEEILDNIDQNCVNDTPFLITDIPEISWSEDNSSEQFDLTDYFKDYENDPLIFTIQEAPQNENIIKSLQGALISFTSSPDWFGEDSIILKASDPEVLFALSNTITLSVLETSEVPELLPLNCETEINEDTQYACLLEIYNPDNDALTFSIGEQENLECEISDSTLTYSPRKDFNGEANCELIVSDIDGSDKILLEVNVLPINDAPEIISFAPASLSLNIPENSEINFSIEAEDIDSATITITWKLNSQVVELNSESYSFSQPQGAYFLEAIVSDSELTSLHSWSIIVGSTSDFTCSEAFGFICSGNSICPSSTFQTNDSLVCCSVACTPSFKNADACIEISDKIKIEITSPESEDKFESGDRINAKIAVKNNLDEEQNLEIIAHLYNSKREKSVEKIETSLDINPRVEKLRALTLEIPIDLDLEDEYALFVKAEDSVCAQSYIPLNIKRLEHNILIDKFEITKSRICQGEPIEVKVRTENIGLQDEDVYITLDNTKLKIKEKTETFELERFDGGNRETSSFFIETPLDASPGDYTITATAFYAINQRETLSEELKIQDCLSNQEESAQVTEIIEAQTSDDGMLHLSSIANPLLQEDPRTGLLSMLMLTSTTIIFALTSILYMYKKRL